MKSKPKFILVFYLAALALMSCSDPEGPTGQNGEAHADAHAPHWGYEVDDGPAAWASMDPAWRLCAEGRAQSPIDLAGATPAELGEMLIDTPSGQEVEVINQRGVVSELDNGHTIQVNSRTGEKTTVGGKTYALVQFHFHAPSEHTVNGEHFPMEVHFVHQADDGALLVSGVFVEEGAPNPGIGMLWAQIGELPGSSQTVRMREGLDEDLFPDDAAGLYHYVGSLTTPPCSEDVQWYLTRTPVELSKAQIAQFTVAYDHNNRPLQALNGRDLYLDDDRTVTIN
jgi:carbonic anhydrase